MLRNSIKAFNKASVNALLGIVLAAVPVSAGPIYSTYLSGANEVPPNSSTATGFSNAILAPNDVVYFDFMFTGLSSPPTALNFNCCGPAGVNEPIALSFSSLHMGATSGDLFGSVDLTDEASYSTAFLTANGGTAALAEAAFLAGLDAGQAYANIPTTNFPGGEIRGQLANLPEPAPAFLIGGVLTALSFLLRRKVA